MKSSALENLLERKEKYRNEVLSLIKKPGNKVAYHFNCPDGIISASIIRYVFSSKDLIFIPFDYALFKDEEILNEISKTEWFAIVDLEPFDSDSIKYFFDHHISNKDKEMKAEHVHFVAAAPCAASLIEKSFSSQIPDYIRELVKISEITDTASYKIPAPLDLQDNPSKLTWDEKIWFLEDVCKTTFSLNDHNKLIEILTFEGWEGLWKTNLLRSVKNLRQTRKKSVEIAKKIEIEDFVIIIDHPLHYNLTFMAREVMKRKSVGVAYLTVYPTEVKVSFRLNKSLTSNQIEKYRVDFLAKSMSGGGHKGASGAEAEDLDNVLVRIKNWAQKIGLKISIADFRKMK